ncbi:peptidoglycan DD-metalloendopeptidase family protein [Pseudomonas alliivorans]|uniref:M23 family metallopeptidase n=1 Tax=Pseudomonas alliivorans TaxID=2810613 RepID=A0ABS4CD88_9PSED|nr:peptidoglycan DD-metalloendopeptidase family protein [Pseudomonas alliivorans]MBP0948681.1 M23 family metallopeptidase [Pseudomonas alliivorans]MEE4329026.1 peptidoglycan DD-metalloendopeptidase family protein [Pseudomonas alliivorans]MEE4335018.1 peptidoglycan DD-metalloendopeptidase family protein [Pseudomonas alliivorans]MEE4370627.1 peptidoglycan DD-metalloendopeptidase family protein [Pseudomonas alliivorans]
MELYNPGAAFHYTSEWNPTRTHPVTGQVRPHRGEDWGAPAGTSIPAAGAGKVVYKGTMNGYGNLVVLEHANGTEIVHTLYAHMSAPSPLALGASVAKGATVGPCGNTGIGTGAHLHFEVLRNGTKGQPNLARGHVTVDPRGFDISNLTNPDGVSPTAPAPAETVAAGGTWQFPIRKAGGSSFKDAEELFAALEKENSGHYLLGSHNFWHGGIHISDQSAPQCVREEPIRCIGNGVVVAYRLNKDYLTSEFAGAEATQTLKYSNSFCLVRHDYKSPANTEVQPGTSNELTFYSLYMHLLPFERYPILQDEIPTPRIKMIASGFRARSDIKGASDCQEYGAISAGAEIEILEEHADRVHAKGKLIKGAVGGRTEGQEFWFAYKQNGASYPKSDGTPSWQEVVPPERTKPGYWKGKVRAVVTASGLTLRQPPASLTHGAAAGQPISAATTQGANQGLVLCTNSTIEFDSAKVLNLKIGTKTVRMAECTFIPSTSGPTTGLKGHSLPVPASFWACVEDVSPNRFVQWQELTPTVFDVVVPMDTAIKAGDPIGYLGLNENIAGPTGGVSSKHQVHVEVFSADPRIEDFLKNKAGVKEGRKYIHIPAATVLKKKPPENGIVEVLAENFVELTKAVPFKDTVDWYEVSILDSGENKSGLIKKESAKIISQHDWELLGFKIFRESNQTSDGFLDPDDMPDFFKNIYKDVDTLGNKDGEVTSEDLTAALKNVEFRQRWSKLIADHPTEWKFKSNTSKWVRLNELLKPYPAVLKHEKERIDNFVFWDDLIGGSAIGDGSGMVKHVNPVSFVGNMLEVTGSSLCKKCGKSIALTVPFMKKISGPTVTEEFLKGFVESASNFFEKYGITTCSQVALILAQGSVETLKFAKFRESLNYSRATYTAESLLNLAPTAINNGLIRKGLHLSHEQKLKYVDDHLLGNDAGYAQHCFGSNDYPNNDYRGRGLLHLTFYETYKRCADAIGVRIDATPSLIETDVNAIVASGSWYWKNNNIGAIADDASLEVDLKVRRVTAKINTGLDQLAKRKAVSKEIIQLINNDFGGCAG